MTTLRVRLALPLGRFALDVAFETSAHVTGLFGRSGAGKSSLLESIIGLRQEAEGNVALDGDVWLDTTRGLRVPPERRHIGYVPQSGLLFPHLTARENLALGERRARARSRDVRALREQVIDVLALGPILDQPTTVLSGGERQRVALGRALCSAPRLLVLDEPLASLDVAMQRRLLPFIRRVREAFDVPMLVVSHAPLEIATLCDRVIALDEGRVIADGAPSAVLSAKAVLARNEHDRLRSVFSVTPVDGHPSRTRIVGSDVHATTRVAHVAAAPPWTLVIPADAVILARTHADETTASNVLTGRVVHVEANSPYAVVHLALADGLQPLLAEVTDASIARLGIAVGATLGVIFKASSCEILEADPDRAS